jgi:hypothetical protein
MKTKNIVGLIFIIFMLLLSVWIIFLSETDVTRDINNECRGHLSHTILNQTTDRLHQFGKYCFSYTNGNEDYPNYHWKIINMEVKQE